MLLLRLECRKSLAMKMTTRDARVHGGLSRAEVARLLGISKVRVAQIEIRALKKLAANPVLRQAFKDLIS